MKNLKLFRLFLFVTLFILSSLAFATVKPVTLVTSEKLYHHEIKDTHKILKKFHKQDPTKNILFFVHGRGKDIKREFQILSELEAKYNVKTILVAWDSWDKLITRPVEEAKASAFDLADLFFELRDYKNIYPEEFETKKMSIFFYSMGNIIFRSYLEDHYTGDLNGHNDEPLFDNLMLFSADVGLLDHKAWLTRLDFAREKMVFMNRTDLVLHASKILDPEYHRLGLGFNALRRVVLNERKYLTNGVKYVDITIKNPTIHAYFNSNSKTMKKLLAPAFEGKEFDLKKIKIDYKHKNGIDYLNL